MQATIAFLIQYGYLVLFVLIFLEQLGLPVPSFPVLLAAGALAGSGQITFAVALAVSVFAALLSDSVWFALGRKRGSTVLRWVCKISLEPDSCVRRTQDIYVRHGAKALLAAKFIPGLNAVAAPLAGIFRMRLHQFWLFDACGVLLWATFYIGLGYVFSNQLESVARYSLRLGQLLGVLLGGALVAYIGRKYYQRHKFLRELRIARITPVELKQMLDSGEPVQIVDLRHSLDFNAEPATLPGAIHVEPEAIEQLLPQIAMDRDLILYCT